MKRYRFARSLATFAACSVALTGTAALAQGGPGGYPDKAVKIVVPFAAGGPTDIMARLLAAKLSENTGKSFYIENQGGAGGNIGMGAVARAAPDGYTILISSPTLVVNQGLYASVPFDPVKDFIPITNVGESTHVVFVHPSFPAKSMKELIAKVKAEPAKHSYSSAGSGTVPHLAFELLKLAHKLDIAHVAHRGAGPAVQSAVSGHIPIGITTLPPVIQLHKGGQLRGTRRHQRQALPDGRRYPDHDGGRHPRSGQQHVAGHPAAGGNSASRSPITCSPRSPRWSTRRACVTSSSNAASPRSSTRRPSSPSRSRSRSRGGRRW